PSFDSMDLPEDYFETRFAPALEAARKYGAPLYCGEYGVIDRAKPEEALKWFSRIHAAFDKFGIARAAWSYKQMDFGLSDARLDGVRGELLRLL
ncbi:MAG: glycosyl hydrolase family 5, partial [Clostridia bacterium]|nr:glycosyl hydrolase family 5 [Clostridia bacterium]